MLVILLFDFEIAVIKSKEIFTFDIDYGYSKGKVNYSRMICDGNIIFLTVIAINPCIDGNWHCESVPMYPLFIMF